VDGQANQGRFSLNREKSRQKTKGKKLPEVLKKINPARFLKILIRFPEKFLGKINKVLPRAYAR